MGLKKKLLLLFSSSALFSAIASVVRDADAPVLMPPTL